MSLKYEPSSEPLHIFLLSSYLLVLVLARLPRHVVLRDLGGCRRVVRPLHSPQVHYTLFAPI